MSRPYKPYLMFIPVVFLGLVAYSARPTKVKPKPLSPAEQQRLRDEAKQREQEMMRKQWQSHLHAEKIMQEKLKTAKHVVIVNGHKMPSETDESDNWFQTGKDGPTAAPSAGSQNSARK